MTRQAPKPICFTMWWQMINSKFFKPQLPIISDYKKMGGDAI
jgi:hypothetical protein